MLELFSLKIMPIGLPRRFSGSVTADRLPSPTNRLIVALALERLSESDVSLKAVFVNLVKPKLKYLCSRRHIISICTTAYTIRVQKDLTKYGK